MRGGGFYEQLKAERARAGQPDTPDYDICVRKTVEGLIGQDAASGDPSMIPSEIQYGKMRTFLGIMALSFDKGVDVVVILTKATKTPGSQMLARIVKEFHAFKRENALHVYDILVMRQTTPPGKMAPQKLVIVAQKEPVSIGLLLELFTERHAYLLAKRVLIIDDEEADFASIRIAKETVVDAEDQRVAELIEELRHRLHSASFLRVMTTPTTLYLQTNLGEQRARACSPEEFRLLVMHQLRVSLRYKRPFSVARIGFVNLAASSPEDAASPPMSPDAVYRVALHAIITLLRSSDFIGACGSNIAIGFPETTPEGINSIVIDRVRHIVTEATNAPIELNVEIAEGEAILPLLATN